MKDDRIVRGTEQVMHDDDDAPKTAPGHLVLFAGCAVMFALGVIVGVAATVGACVGFFP